MRHATHSKLKENDSFWLPQLQWHQNCANNMLWWMGGSRILVNRTCRFRQVGSRRNLLRLDPVLFSVLENNKWCKQRCFAARIKQTPYENSLLFYNQTSMQQKKASKQSKTKAMYCLPVFINLCSINYTILHDIILVFPYTVVVCLLFFSGQWLSETHRAGCCQVTQSPGGETEGRGNLNDL